MNLEELGNLFVLHGLYALRLLIARGWVAGRLRSRIRAEVEASPGLGSRGRRTGAPARGAPEAGGPLSPP